MKRNSVFLACVLLLGGIRCFALDATEFFQKHACVPAGEHASRCPIHPGDTLSKDALAVYGDWHRYPAIKDANPEIADANRIYVGKWIIIPNTPTAPSAAIIVTPRVQPRAIVAPKATLELAPEPTTTLASVIPTEEIAANVPTSDLPLSSPETTATMTETDADPSPRSPQPPPAQSKPAKTPISVKAGKVATVSGYQMVIPHDRAFRIDGTPLVPIGLNLPTQIGIFNHAADPKDGIPPARVMNTISRVKVMKGEGRNLVLIVSFPQELPAHYIVHIDGIGSIDGNEFTSHAEIFSGRFPGQHNILGTLMTGGSFVGSGLMLTGLSGNPLIGFGTAAGTWGAQWTIHHIRMAALKRAERKYQERALLLAERQTTQEKTDHAE